MSMKSVRSRCRQASVPWMTHLRDRPPSLGPLPTLLAILVASTQAFRFPAMAAPTTSSDFPAL